MIIKQYRLKTFLTLILVWTFLIGSLPVKGQGDIVGSSDLAGGSSVFVFRTSRKAKQRKVAFRSEPKRTIAQKRETRVKVVRQTTTVAKNNQKNRPTKRVDPQSFARMGPQIKVMPPKEASLIFAGAGEYYLERDDLAQAIDFFIESVTLDSTNRFGRQGLSDSYVRKGNEHLEKDENDKAKFFFEEAVKYDDRNATAFAGLGDVFDALGQDQESLENYEKALQIDGGLTELYAPVGVLYFQQRKIPEAEKYLTKALETAPNDAQTQYFLGLVRYRQNRLDDALTAFRRSLQTDANNAEAYYFIGEVYGKQGKEKEAIAEYQKATQINPKYLDAWFDLGVAQYNDENYSAAVSAYEKVIQLKNDYWEAYANLGDTYRLMNEPGKAEGSYRVAVSRIKDDAELHSKFGYVLGVQRKWKPSIEQLNNALNIDKSGFDYANIGWAYYNVAQENLRGRREADAKVNLQNGKIALQKAIELNPDNEAAYLNLGITLIDLQDYAGAAKALERAVVLRKDWLPAHNELGLAYRQLGNLDDAIKQFRKVVEINDKFAAGYYNLGEALYRNRKSGDAKKMADKLKPLNPGLARKLELMIAAPNSL